MATSSTNVNDVPCTVSWDVWYEKHGVGAPAGGLAIRLDSRICELVVAGLLVALKDTTLRYRLLGRTGSGPVAALPQVYSTYTIVPSPLMSPYSLSTHAVDGFVIPEGGITPVGKPPSRARTVPAA